MAEKTLCKLVKEDILDQDLSEYLKLITESRYVCLKCGRTSNKKKRLCKPAPLNKKKKKK